ncbi:hypothetical protein LIA77_06351 [Sarocladium implicatum]|nr:hypothetical protein LIA77_06351 [Sarocladium implicatum]
MAPPQDRKDDASMYTWTQPNAEIQHTNPQPPKISDAVSTINTDSFWTLPQKPCVRQSLLTGIGAGAAIVGLTVVVRGGLRKALNVGVFSGITITGGSYENCRYQKRMEAANMKRAVDVVREAKLQKEAQEEAAAKTVAVPAPAPAEEKNKRSWYRFW